MSDPARFARSVHPCQWAAMRTYHWARRKPTSTSSRCPTPLVPRAQEPLIFAYELEILAAGKPSDVWSPPERLLCRRAHDAGRVPVRRRRVHFGRACCRRGPTQSRTPCPKSFVCIWGVREGCKLEGCGEGWDPDSVPGCSIACLSVLDAFVGLSLIALLDSWDWKSEVNFH